MKQKPCIHCKRQKPLTDYYRHPKMADGRLGVCKECHKAQVARARARNLEYYREYDKKRYRENQDRKELTKARFKALYDNRSPEVAKAHNAVSNAVRSGRLVRPEKCSKCGCVGNIEGHHDDYNKPLDVRWLCRPCHMRHHRLQWLTENQV